MGVLTALSPRTLRELGHALIARAAAAEEAVRPEAITLDPEGVERLAAILARGDRPSVGLFRRHGRRDGP